MEVVYSNCFGAPERDLLVTDELLVAEAASSGVATVLADERYDPDLAQAINTQLGELAHSWATLAGPDPTLCDGVAAADLAGVEALASLLQPAARGVLDARAALDSPSRVTVATPKTSDPRFDRVERVIGEGFAAAAGVPVDLVTVVDPRTDALVAKYELTRNPPFRQREGVAGYVLARVTAASVNTLSRLRGRRPVRVLVFDYRPTTAFARVYRARGGGPFGLVRSHFGSRDLPTMIRAGDRALTPLGGSRLAPRDVTIEQALTAYVERHRDDLRARFIVAGVDLWEIVGERMVELALDYASWMHPRLARVRRTLQMGRVGAVLVPFEGPPEARLVLRVAQSLGIPTLMINDGWRGDDHLQDGMDADRALAWSSEIAHNYFGRRRHGHPTIVTGNPRNDEAPIRSTGALPPGGALRRVLVGSFACSPSDLNCRRSDPERFLVGILEGIAASHRARGAHVVIKLHPADRPQSYESLLGGFPELDIEVRQEGDVLGLFAEVDVYITTHSTSLLEAAAFGLPVVYYRVNQQRLHTPFSPFSDDREMAARTASCARELTSLLDASDRLALPDGEVLTAWLERHLGPADGHCSERVAAALIADAFPKPTPTSSPG
ncbi:MAG: hypothetical protein ACRDJ3_03620 [Solirubrobacteraceae bacterium]